MMGRGASDEGNWAVSGIATIFKAYDVRGRVPEEWDEGISHRIGEAFADFVAQDSGASTVVIAHDMRGSSVPLVRQFINGVTSRGVDVISLGLASTDLLYYAAGSLDVPGAMITASHNPREYNGIKMCRAGAAPIGEDTGLATIRDLAAHPEASVKLERTGRVSSRDLLSAYAAHLRSIVDLSTVRPLRVVIDAGNGMAGHTAHAVFNGLPITVVPLYFDLDGSFPNHDPDPMRPENRRDLKASVAAHSADIGLAFDGDADRVFVVDERGDSVTPSTISALIASQELARCSGGTVLHGLIMSRAVSEVVREHGGEPLRVRVGHSFIKAEMARTNAIFAAEHSGHYYFRDFWGADTGMLAAMHVLAALGKGSSTLSELVQGYKRYVALDETNLPVADPACALATLRSVYTERSDAKTDELDGLTVELVDGTWFNLRIGNTEPLLRLNVEAPDNERIASIYEEILRLLQLPVAVPDVESAAPLVSRER